MIFELWIFDFMIFTPSSISQFPESPGIYKFFDITGTLLYIGKAKNLKKRVYSYFHKKDLDVKTKLLVSQIHSIEIHITRSEFESLILESRFIHTYKPKYNVIWKDDKHYIYIKVTREEFPRILYARKDDDTKSFLYGPFPSTSIVKDMLSYLRRIFPYCTARRDAKRSCFYTHLGLCNPCPTDIQKMAPDKRKEAQRGYRMNTNQIKEILEGHIGRVKSYLLKEMKNYSEQLDFERAAQVRDRLKSLTYLTQNFHPYEKYLDLPTFSKDQWRKEETELLALLAPFFPTLKKLDRLECFDISNISGKFATGSMVTFVNGTADKRYYRHFRVRTIHTPNDFAMLSEIVGRRLKHKEWGMPQLFIFDGGKPQLIALSKVFKQLGLSTPYIGIAKVEEELVIPLKNSFDKIRLTRDSAALHLVLRLRDEAHRFAKKYHTKLQIRYLLKPLENS